MSVSDIILLLFIALLAGLAIFWHIKRKRANKGCCGGCSGCSASGSCSSQAKTKP